MIINILCEINKQEMQIWKKVIFLESYIKFRMTVNSRKRLWTTFFCLKIIDDLFSIFQKSDLAEIYFTSLKCVAFWEIFDLYRFLCTVFCTDIIDGFLNYSNVFVTFLYFKWEVKWSERIFKNLNVNNIIDPKTQCFGNYMLNFQY